MQKSYKLSKIEGMIAQASQNGIEFTSEQLNFLKDFATRKEEDRPIDLLGNNDFMMAAKRGDIETVEKVLASNSSSKVVCQVNILGKNALMLAAEKGHTAVVKALLDSPKLKNQAVSQVSVTTTYFYLEREYDEGSLDSNTLKEKLLQLKLTPTNKNGMNALMLAVKNAHVGVVRALLDSPKITAETTCQQNERGDTALMIAVNELRREFNGHDKARYIEIVKALLDSDKFTRDAVCHINKDGDSALYTAFVSYDIILFKLLLSSTKLTVMHVFQEKIITLANCYWEENTCVEFFNALNEWQSKLALNENNLIEILKAIYDTYHSEYKQNIPSNWLLTHSDTIKKKKLCPVEIVKRLNLMRAVDWIYNCEGEPKFKPLCDQLEKVFELEKLFSPVSNEQKKSDYCSRFFAMVNSFLFVEQKPMLGTSRSLTYADYYVDFMEKWDANEVENASLIQADDDRSLLCEFLKTDLYLERVQQFKDSHVASQP